MNPIKLLKLKNLMDEFQVRHPKFPLFMKKIYKDAMIPGSLFEVKVTTPDGKSYVSNIRLTQEDLNSIQEIKTLKK